MVSIFIHLFFTKNSVVQTAQLHDSSDMQHLETMVHSTLHGAYFEPEYFEACYKLPNKINDKVLENHMNTCSKTRAYIS